MLMPVRVDFHQVEAKHEAIHERLTNWERWVRVRPHGWQTHPMFRLYMSKARQWHSPIINSPVDTLDAVLIEKAVSALPNKQRDAIRWWYVLRRDPASTARALGVSTQGLADLVSQGRTMLKNNLHSAEICGNMRVIGQL